MDQKEMKINIDFNNLPILFTDSMHYDQNEDVVFINALQGTGVPGNMRAVARLCMPRSFAKRVLNDLTKLLALSEKPKRKEKNN